MMASFKAEAEDCVAGVGWAVVETEEAVDSLALILCYSHTAII